MIRFSIIVPCYKCAQYVRTALDSVLAQKVVDWEMICTDDGSPDETGRVLDEYLREHFDAITEEERIIKSIGDEDRHPDSPKRILSGVLSSGARMTVVHQQNSGVSGARNTAMTLATGEWLLFLDGDDLLTPNALGLVDECLTKAPNADCVYCGYVSFNDGERLPQFENAPANIRVVDVSKELPGFLFAFGFQRMLFRRELVKDIAFKGVSCTEEAPYCFSCHERTQVLVATDSVLYFYRILAGSMSHRRVSLLRCNQAYDRTRRVTRLISESHKMWPRWIIRTTINMWGEGQSNEIHCLARREDRIIAYQYWISKLHKLKKYRHLCTTWQLLVLTIALALPYRVVLSLVYYFPYWLKARGYHR